MQLLAHADHVLGRQYGHGLALHFECAKCQLAFALLLQGVKTLCQLFKNIAFFGHDASVLGKQSGSD